MRSQFKLAWYYIRMATGILLAAIATAALPKSATKTALVNAIEPLEWEAK